MSATAELEDDLDLGEYTPEGVEKEVANGGKVPPGKYHVRLEKVGDKTCSKDGKFFFWPLTFAVAGGPLAGMKIAERLHDFENGAADKNKRDLNNRFLLFASRLGYYSAAGGTYKKVKPSLADCIGAEVIVEVKHREYKGEMYANITFGGIYTLTDPKVKDVTRGAAEGQPAAVPAGGGIDLSTL